MDYGYSTARTYNSDKLELLEDGEAFAWVRISDRSKKFPSAY